MIKNNMMAINEIDDNDNNDGALCEHRWRSDHNWNQVEIGTIFFSQPNRVQWKSKWKRAQALKNKPGKNDKCSEGHPTNAAEMKS